jgi:quercetin dioxygenase-like cupin family protein
MLDRLAAAVDPDSDSDSDPDLDPDAGEVLDTELVVTDDALVKLFALGPDAELSSHDHPGSTNVFHVVEGTVAVTSGGTTETVAAPGVVLHGRGTVHGARNETDERALLTATLCPMPG